MERPFAELLLIQDRSPWLSPTPGGACVWQGGTDAFGFPLPAQPCPCDRWAAFKGTLMEPSVTCTACHARGIARHPCDTDWNQDSKLYLVSCRAAPIVSLYTVRCCSSSTFRSNSFLIQLQTAWDHASSCTVGSSIKPRVTRSCMVFSSTTSSSSLRS